MLRFFKETAVPTTFEPSAVYFIAPAGRTTALEIYVTDVFGTAARHVINASEIQTMIDLAIAATGNTVIVDDIAARDAIDPKINAMSVFVTDASADATVESGWATYVWRSSNNTWIKTSEGENLDLINSWNNLQDRPTSSPALIDAAVTARHTHANKTELDKISEDEDGQFTYAGALPHIGFDSANW